MPIIGGGGGASYITARDCALLAFAVGIPESQLTTCVAIAIAESGLNIFATGYNGATPGCPNGSRDRGLWQINDCYHPNVPDSQAYSAQGNAQAMVAISSRGTNWHPWSTFNSGAYLRYVGQAQSAVDGITHGGYPVPSAPPPYSPGSALVAAVRSGQNPIGAAAQVFRDSMNHIMAGM